MKNHTEGKTMSFHILLQSLRDPMIVLLLLLAGLSAAQFLLAAYGVQ
jgi:hypothetical protein